MVVGPRSEHTSGLSAHFEMEKAGTPRVPEIG